MKQITKNRILIIGFVLLLLAIYRITLVKTINLSVQVANLEHSVRNTSELAKSNLMLEGQLRYNDSILKANNLQNSSVQNQLLTLLNKQAMAKGFSITQFFEPHEYASDIGLTQSYQFSLRGDYNSLQQILFELETSQGLGKIAHVRFKKQRDYRKNKNYLECEVITQVLGSVK